MIRRFCFFSVAALRIRHCPTAFAAIGFASILFALATAASAIGWLPVGPYGGALVVADPIHSGRAYASLAHLLYRTGDAGANWSVVHRFDPPASIGSIAPDPFVDNTLYVTTGQRVWKSTDGGATFAAIEVPGVNDSLRILASPARPQLLYAYQRLAVFRSDDGGATWINTSRNDIATFFTYLLTPHPAEPETLYLSSPTAVRRSLDAGRTWTTVHELSSAFFPVVQIARSDPRQVVIDLIGNGIAVSNDSGATWTTLTPPELMVDLAVDRTNPDRWTGASYKAVDGGAGSMLTIRETTDAGATWQVRGSAIAPGRNSPPSLLPRAGLPDSFYVASTSTVLRTDDHGASFAVANFGLRDVADVPVQAGDALLAASAHGVRRSADFGDHWNPMTALVPGISYGGSNAYSLGDHGSVVLVASPVDPQRVLALAWEPNLIAVSRDGGASWSSVDGVPGGAFSFRGAIAADPLNADAFDAVLVAQLGGTSGSTTARIVHSNDFGATLSVLPAPTCPVTQGIVYTIARSRSSAHRLLLGRPCGIAWTDDNGANWNIPATPFTYALAEHPDDPLRWLAGTADGLYASADDGAVWQRFAFPGKAVRAIAFDPALSSHIVAALDDGVWSTSDAGVTWVLLDEGMLQNAATGVGFAEGVLFAATNEGLYRCASLACSAGAPVRTTKVVEFHNRFLNHYFIVEDGDEAAGIDAGAAGPGWSRTGQSFNGFSFAGALPEDAGSVCRFYGTPGAGPNSHFYTIFPEECDAVAGDPGWTLESRSILITGWPATTCTAAGCTSSCGTGRTPVMRLYNDRFAFNDSNHRYTTDPAIHAAMQAQGWTPEGVVFCSP